MAKPSGKKFNTAKSKLRNKYQSKKNSSRNRKSNQKRPKNQSVVIQKQSSVKDGHQSNNTNTGADEGTYKDEDYLDALGFDATLDDIDYLLNNRGNLSFLSQALDR